MYVDEGFNERIESKRENVGGVGKMFLYFTLFRLVCFVCLMGLGWKQLLFLGVVYFSMIVFIITIFL